MDAVTHFIFLGSKITVDGDCSHEIKRCLLLERKAMTNLNSVLGFPRGSAGKESTCNAGDLGSIAGLGRSPGEGKGYPLQYSGLENSMDSPWGHKGSDMTERLSLSHGIKLSAFTL